MSATRLIADLQRRGITLEAAADRLRFRPATAMTVEDVDALKALKADLLTLLAAEATPPDGAPHGLIALAARHAWPMVPLRPGCNIGGTEFCWRDFVRTAIVGDRLAARAYLERLRLPAHGAEPERGAPALAVSRGAPIVESRAVGAVGIGDPRTALVALAAQRDWPQTRLRPSVTVVPTAIGWAMFARTAALEDVQAALGSLATAAPTALIEGTR